MSTYRQRRLEQKAEMERIKGRKDFPDSVIDVKDEDCEIPVYCVSWTDKRGKLTGNSWTNKEKAIQVMEKMIEKGVFHGTRTCYCAGFLF